MDDIATNKDVLMSIKPQYAFPLTNGTKTIELRRKFPTDLPTGTRIMVYASSPISKVIGECEIRHVIKLPIAELWNHACIEAMISFEGFIEYFKGCDSGYAIHVYKSVRYECEKLLIEMAEPIKRPPQSYMYVERPIEL